MRSLSSSVAVFDQRWLNFLSSSSMDWCACVGAGWQDGRNVPGRDSASQVGWANHCVKPAAAGVSLVASCVGAGCV